MYRSLLLPHLNHEQKLWDQGLSAVVGIDEVGRGALAGPIVVGAVIFDKNHQPLAGINDSKMLSGIQRQKLEPLIKVHAGQWAIGVGSVDLINQRGIIWALKVAITRALDQLTWDAALLDGKPFVEPIHTLENKAEFIIKGDQQSYSIAAASIIAKVYRDNLMANLASSTPEYGWAQNAGYGTKLHQQAIRVNGLTPHHRQLFCRKLAVSL